jgi:uroporphyrinogen decarboxylase
MTSRERMCRVLNHECPDRLPIFDYAIDPKVVRAIDRDGDYADVVDALDFDAITAWEPSTGGYADETQGREPGEEFVDEWGVHRQATEEMSACPLEKDVVIRSQSDLQNLSIPDPGSEHRFGTLRRYVDRFGGTRFVSYAILDMFELSRCLMGFQNFLIAFSEEPVLVRNVLGMTTDWVVQVAQKAADIGADMILDLSDIAWTNGTLVSREILQAFFFPCLAKVVNAVKQRRAYAFYHTHGNISRVLDLVVATGIDVLHPLDPDAGMDIGSVKRVHGSKIVVAGNISTRLLSTGTREEIVNLTRETIERTSGGGGHILMSSSSVLSSVNPVNYLAMVETARAFGTY